MADEGAPAVLAAAAAVPLRADAADCDGEGAEARIDGIMKGWYSEVGSLWPGQAMSLKVRALALVHARSAACVRRVTSPPWRVQVKAVLHQAKSDFQDVLARARARVRRPRSLHAARALTPARATPVWSPVRRFLTRRRTAACSCSTAAYS
jgi:hypothetical protein